MTTSNFWGFQEKTPDKAFSAPYDTSTVIRESLRDESTTSNLPRQNASPIAQTSGGIGIQNIKRAFLNAVPSPLGVDFQTTSTSYVRAGSELSGSVETSGRPLMLLVRGNAGISSGYATISVLLNGEEVTGGDGMSRVYPSNQETFFGMFVATPPVGTQSIAMIWKTSTGSNVLMPRSCRPSVTAVEI